jgi:hypothetical protein
VEKKTTIYVLASFVLILIGVIFLLASPFNSIIFNMGISIIAGGLASLAFAVIRYFDDLDSVKQASTVQETLLIIKEEQVQTRHMLDSTALVIDDPNRRCVFSRQITHEFRLCVQSIASDDELEIDVIGFSLIRFYHEQLEYLLTKRRAKIRLIVQDPTKESFRILTQQEGRDLSRARDEIIQLSNYILDKAQSGYLVGHTSGSGGSARFVTNNSDVELRWFPYASTATITRIGDIAFVRPRFLDEARDAPMFFEKYRRSDGRAFDAYVEYFENAWSKSTAPQKMIVESEK